MGAGATSDNGASADAGVSGPADSVDVGARRWPVSAVCSVAFLAVLVLVLAAMNVLGVQVFGDDGYDADVGGTAAEWFGAIATLVALPAAVLFGVRQLQSSGEVIELERRKWDAERAERADRERAELAAVRSAVQLRVEVVNVLDAGDMATAAEQAAMEQWRQEYRQRGWVPDAATSTWQQGAVSRSNTELLSAEASPLLPRPWFVVATCRNTGPGALDVDQWTAQVDGVATTIAAPTALGSDGLLRRRLGAEVGMSEAYATHSAAEAAAVHVAVVVHGRDGTGRPVRIVQPARE